MPQQVREGCRWLLCAYTFPLGYAFGPALLCLGLIIHTPAIPLSRAEAELQTLGEALDNETLAWETGGDALWFGQTQEAHDGVDAAQSGSVQVGKTSWLRTTVEGPGLLSFYWKVSATIATMSLKFYLDGEQVYTCASFPEWRRCTLELAAGEHTLQWTFNPALITTAGFVDQMVYRPAPALLLETPAGGETWKHREFAPLDWLLTDGSGEQVRLELYRDATPARVVAEATPNDGGFSWFIPPSLASAGDYRLKVSSLAYPALSDQNEDFFDIGSWYQTALLGALILDGANDRAGAADSAVFDTGAGGESFTLEAWPNLNQSSTGPFDRQHLLGKQGSYDFYAVRYRDISSSSYMACLGLEWTNAGGGVQGKEHCRSSGYGLGWHHAALVYTAGVDQARFYLDGSAYGVAFTLGGALANSLSPLVVGDNFAGALDEVRLSAVERYSGETYAPPEYVLECDADTRALWHFDEVDGMTVFSEACGAAGATLNGENGAATQGAGGQAQRIHLPLVRRY